MENLKKKTFSTIFTIISIFALLFAVIFNVQTYRREYQEIVDNLTRMENVISNKKDLHNVDMPRPIDNEELRNRKVMDYEVYTFLLDSNNSIVEQISHSDNTISLEMLKTAQTIVAKNKKSKLKIGCLYIRNYAYNLNAGHSLTIVNTTDIKEILLINLFISLVLVGLGEIIIYLFTKKITVWITQPVLESFNREKEFVANASHELKTPLAVMVASIDCLEVNKKNEKWINNLKSESERMNNLITRLLDLSKSESYLTEENFSQNDLSMIVEKRALTFESLAYEKRIAIETAIQEKISLLCHKESIDELVSILIDNAISHSEEDSKVFVNLSKNKSEIKLEVINQGEAIPPEDCEKIFERFYRNDKSHHRKENRYGLGLAIAKNIVEAHHGKIRAFSKDGYTTFEVILKVNEH